MGTSAGGSGSPIAGTTADTFSSASPDRGSDVEISVATESGAVVKADKTGKGGRDTDEFFQESRIDGAEDPTLELERKKKVEKVKTVSLRKLFGFADELDVLLMIVGSIGAIGNGLSQPLVTLLMGRLVNAFGNASQSPSDNVSNEVNKVVLYFFYFGIGAGVAAYLEVACWTVAGERQAARIRRKYLRAVLRQDISFFDTDTSTGEIIIRMAGDIELIHDAIGENVGKIIAVLATFAGGFTVAFIKSWKLTLVLMTVIPLLVAIGVIMGILYTKMTSQTQTSYLSAGALVEQVTSNIRTVASYSGEQKAVQDYDKNLQKAEKAGIMQGLVGGMGFGFVFGVLYAGYAITLWYGSKLILEGSLNGGQVLNVLFAVVVGAMASGRASPAITAMAAGRGAAYNIFEVIGRVPVIDSYNNSGLVPEKVKGNVELQKVDFRYPTRPDVLVFSKFSLSIPAGKTIALVGESGSGKSTVVNLIQRFYDPESGEVLLDGVDIKTIQLKWLRKQMGLVSQEPVLFNTSIKENIAYGKDNATMEEISTAAVLANASKFIMKIPTGYETLVGERGIQLSGGQKQRVAIARAILKSPRILLLDEATSALDAESERVVQEALERIMTDRTTVVVAHRLTTIRNADVIAVVQGGEIVETGTHDKLLQKPYGAYSKLVHLQEIYGKDQPEPEALEDPTYVPEGEEEPIVEKVYGLSAKQSRSFGNSTNKEDLSDSEAGPGNKNALQVRGSWTDGDRKLKAGTEKEAARTKKNDKNVSIFRLAKLNRPEAPLILIGAIAAAGSGMVYPTSGLLLSSVLSSFFKPPHQLRTDVNYGSLMFLLLAIFVALTNPIQYYMFAITGSKLIRRVRRITLAKMLCQEISWFDEEGNSSGVITGRFSTDAAAVSILGDGVRLIVSNLSTIVTGFVITFTASWQMTLVLLSMVPLLGFQAYAQVQWMKGFSTKAEYEEATRIATDSVSSIRTVASFVAEERVCNLYDDKCKEPVKTGIRQGLVAGISLGFSNFVLFSIIALSFFVGGKLVQRGTTTFKEVFRIFLVTTSSVTVVTTSLSFFPDFGKVKSSINSIFAIIDRKSKIDPSDMSGKILSVAKGDIEFQHVSFFYPTRPDIQVFQNLSFKVQAGQTLAIVGESGSGKSTVISLIERFYDPQSGVILVDGVDIQKLQLKWLRQHIGLVSQEPVLFDENVDWNIVYGLEGKVTEAEIRAAAKAANAHKFISSLPDGYKTRVGERGAQFSGGQKQRVAIARAILKDPKILLLDEATSALDAESEYVVQEALDRMMVSRTTIIVAHRLTTVRNADIIVVIKDGIIVEQGKHEELITKPGGAYASLYSETPPL